MVIYKKYLTEISVFNSICPLGVMAKKLISLFSIATSREGPVPEGSFAKASTCLQLETTTFFFPDKPFASGR